MDTLDQKSTSPKPEAKEALRARPVKGQIDYVELTRNTMKKFPKILAALAK